MHMSCLTCYLAASHSSIFVLSWGTYKSNEVVTTLAAVSDAWDSTRSAASVSQQTHCRALIAIKYRTNQLKTTKSDVLFNKIQSPPCINQPKVMFCSWFTDLLFSFDRKTTHWGKNIHVKVSHLNVILQHFRSEIASIFHTKNTKKLKEHWIRWNFEVERLK